MKELENSTVDGDGEITTDDVHGPINGETNASNESAMFSDDIDSSCSTPYVSAPSSPGRGPPLGGFYYSAPSSPMHFLLSHSAMSLRSSRTEAVQPSMAGTFEFDFSARLATNGLPSAGSMSSADELFFNGQIRPMKLSTHLQRPQRLAPLLDLDENVDGECDDDDESGDHHEKSVARGRDKKLPDRSFRRRTRSMSPMRTVPFQWREEEEEDDDEEQQKSMETTDAKLDEEGKHGEMVLDEATPSESASSSRSSSVGRNSKRWIFLKEFLYRSKSEGRNNGHKFWSSISFSPVKDKKPPASSSNSSKEKTAAAATTTTTADAANEKAETKKGKQTSKEQSKKAANGKMGNRGGKRRVPPSAHELHYTANRAQAEEMRKKTFLPYRQGLLGCLGFSSKSYGAMSGFARALNPVYSR